MLEADLSCKALIVGIETGMYNGSGKGIYPYLEANDLRNARRTVNITDRWKTIANYYYDFARAINYSIVLENEDGAENV